MNEEHKYNVTFLSESGWILQTIRGKEERGSLTYLDLDVLTIIPLEFEDQMMFFLRILFFVFMKCHP